MAEARDERLRLLVDRIERLMQERKGITDDIRDVFAEAKALGYDTATLRRVIARRGMQPDARDEADQLVETYEAALGGMPVAIPDARTDLRAMAEALLEEQIAGIEDPELTRKLVDRVAALLDIRAEIAALREQEAAQKALAKADGFVVKAISATVQWIEKCAKHGRDAMRASEAVFQMYRGTVEGRGVSSPDVTADPALQQFLPKPRTIGGAGGRAASALAWHDAGEG